MKKILVIQRDPLLSGVQKVFLSEYENLREQYEYHLVCNASGPLTECMPQHNVHIITKMKRKINVISDLIVLYKLYIIIRNLRPDIVHTHSSKPGIYGGILKLVLSFKLVHTVHGFSFTNSQNYLFYFFSMLLEGIFGRARDLTIVLTNRDYVKATQIGLRPEHLLILKNAPNKTSIAGEISKTKNTFCWMGRIELQKDPLTFVKAAILCLDERQDAVFEVWGEGGLSAILQAEIDSVSVEKQKRIKLMGWCDDPIEVLSKCEYFVTTSLYEGMPLVLLEAMVARCHLIASNIPEHFETIEDHNFMPFPIQDHVTLSKIMLEMSARTDCKNLPEYQLQRPEDRADQLNNIYKELT
ncbi:glycosyltransferase [bacterium]|nr:glycosyltransferase [bacterium]